MQGFLMVKREAYLFLSRLPARASYLHCRVGKEGTAPVKLPVSHGQTFFGKRGRGEIFTCKQSGHVRL